MPAQLIAGAKSTPPEGLRSDAEVLDIEAVLRLEAPGLLRYLQRHTPDPLDAADQLSDVFLVAWRRSADLPDSAQEARMWLFGIARRTLATHLRTGQRRTKLVEALAAQLATDPGATARGDGQESAAEHCRAADVRTAMAALRTTDREILALVHWDGFTLTEAATLLSIRPGAARTRYQRARQRITAALNSA